MTYLVPKLLLKLEMLTVLNVLLQLKASLSVNSM